MHRCRSWLFLGLWAACLAPISAQATTVYKWTDAQGVVHYSDQPVDGAEKITTSSSSGHNGIMSQPSASTAKPTATQKKPTLADAQISIASPAPEQTFTGGESVPVRLSMTPAPGPDLQITWVLNGAQLQQAPDATDFTLTDLARGVYTLEATVTDASTGETRSADPVTFNVMRPSLLSPQHK